VKMNTDAEEDKQVKQFKYLGSVITEDGYCDQDIKSRITIRKNAHNLLISQLDLELRNIIVKATVWSVALVSLCMEWRQGP